MALQCNTCATNCNVEKDLDQEKRKKRSKNAKRFFRLSGVLDYIFMTIIITILIIMNIAIKITLYPMII